MTTFIEDLKKNVKGDVLDRPDERSLYENDESIFSITPKAVVFPKRDQDVEAIIQIADYHNVPVTARGGGTGIAGQSIGSGIIINFSKYMNQILDMSADQVIVQPGLILQTLNDHLLKKGKKFAPDPGSKDQCTIGGMVANNAAGPHALSYGSTRDHVKHLEVILSNGRKTDTRTLSFELESYVNQIKVYSDKILASKRNVDKNSSGYFLEGLLGATPSFEKLLVGSEGTLAMVTQATLDLVSIPEHTTLAVMGFDSMGKAVKHVKALRESKACCIELLDQTILNVIRNENPALIKELKLENASVSLWVEWNGPIPADFKNLVLFSSEKIEEIRRMWGQRSKVSRWLHSQAANQKRKPLRCIEDACVPIDSLVTYIMELNDLLDRHDCKGAIFGHIGNGHLHVNPGIKTDGTNLRDRIQVLTDEFYNLVLELGGTISGEHGDGILRVPYAKKQWKDIWSVFELVKKTFDPKGIFNPDKKVPMTPTQWPALKY
jgi:FAD/FMN-containing dehydrogenase